MALRPQLDQHANTNLLLKHGERVSVLDMRRRFVKVRSASGVEGWLDSLDLLTPEDMQRLREERAAALKLSSEGKATAYETLNIHIEPSRKAASFAQIPEGAPVDVLARKLIARQNEAARPTFTYVKPVPLSRRSKKQKGAKNAAKLPPRPAPPKPPKDAQEVWGSGESEQVDQGSQKEDPKDTAPAVMESWTLVRTSDNKVGWALTRNLMMAIPDEVAQYAAGARITSYFDLGTVNDERDGPKHNWLWTTAGTLDPADFDAWRVFFWNRRRHRYETSYRKRDLQGYFPVHVDAADPDHSGRSFEIITKDDDDKMRRRSYSFDGTLVHLISTEDYRQTTASLSSLNDAPVTQPAQGSWLARQWDRLKGLVHRKH